MSRFYTLSIGATLFGDVQLTRRWGRIGSRGQAMSHTFAREVDAVRLFLGLLRHKRKRGYRPRGRAAETKCVADRQAASRSSAAEG